MNSKQMEQLGINEIYLPIDDFPNYEVSNYGNVRNINFGRILTPDLCSNGYYRVSLSNKGKAITKQIHRLVLTTFEENSDNKKYYLVEVETNMLITLIIIARITVCSI